ncbi:MAG: response regulator [Flavobacteriaceae bacterium]|nr:MAG: response regulator [Flavobacteriaceae bacterium]
MTVYTALLIDDHPIITNAYESAFHDVQKEDETVSFTIHIAHNCDTAYEVIKEHSEKGTNLDVVFLDMSLPASKDKKILSGEDLGLKINEMLPASRIIVATAFNDNYRIHSIFKNLNPDGFLIKNDIDPEVLITSVKEVLREPPYYSKTVSRLLRTRICSDFLLDDIDRRILYELSIGTKMKDIENVPLSVHGIEKRKRLLKEIFNIKGSDDRELIFVAKEKGFI